jgi:hypothetical protein
VTLLNAVPPGPNGRPNIFDDPVPWNQVRVAGLLILALAVKFNGFKVEDTWKKQKSKEANGAIFSFGGTDPVGGESGFSVTFRVTSREEFQQLYDIYDAIKPLPVAGGAAAATNATPAATKAVGSPAKQPDASAQDLLKQAQAALEKLNNPTPAATSTDPAAAASSATAKEPSPGPRPPTVPIELGWLAFLGVFAVARKSWEFSTIEQDKIEVTIGFVQDKPPTPAGAGAMGPAKAPGAEFGATAAPTPAQYKQAAGAGAAGT